VKRNWVKRNKVRRLTWPREWRNHGRPGVDNKRTDRKFSPEAKVYYEMGPNGPGTIGKAQYVKAWGGSDEAGVLLDR
jgi:hypothetical protein